jgi:DNA-binding response OmpR family regulator
MHIVVDLAGDRLQAEVVDLLRRAGHTVERGAAAACARFDLALVGTPEAAERLKRARPHDAIVVVTKLGDVPARVRALELGADDAVDAGFPASQIVARVGAASRRVAMLPRPAELLAIDGCTIDLSASTAARDGRTTALTTREVEVIRYLARHAGQVVSRGELLHHVWRVAAGNQTRAVDVAVVGLRAKLERDPASPAIIVSVRGAGYRWG